MKTAKLEYAQYLYRRYGDRSTPKHYLNDLELFIDFVGEKAPQAVTKHDIERFIEDQRKRGLKATSVNRRLASLHHFFEYAASEVPDAAWPNPVEWRRQRVKQGSSLRRDGSEQEVAQLFTVIDDPRDYAMFGLMVGAGLRVGEVVSVQCAGLEKPSSAEEASRLRVIGKGRKERVVWLTPHWYAAVAAWLAIRPTSSATELFLNQHDQPLSVAGVQYRLKAYTQRAKVKLSCHQLRHTFARRLAEQSMPIESIARLMGHVQVATTQVYTAGADPALRNAFLDAMNAYATDAPVAPMPLVSNRFPPRTAEVADTAFLDAAIVRLAALPAWLQPTLTAYLRRRWRDWQPHRAAYNANQIVRRLVHLWQWFVSERQIGGWEQLHRRDIEAWLDALTVAGAAVNTRRSQLGMMLGCLRYACDEGQPISATLFRVPLPAAAESLPRALNPEQYTRLLQYVAQSTSTDRYRDLLDWTWFLTLAHTGIRSCELLNLRLADIDLASRRLFVQGGKTADERIVFLTPALTDALARYLVQRPTVNDDHLWIDVDDRPLSSIRIRYRTQCWGQACQIAFSPHRLRHTLATQLVNQGMPLASIAKLLGHRSLSTTQHYARLYELTVKEQFLAAVEHIEGIAVPDWPVPNSIPVIAESSILVDSV